MESQRINSKKISSLFWKHILRIRLLSYQYVSLFYFTIFGPYCIKLAWKQSNKVIFGDLFSAKLNNVPPAFVFQLPAVTKLPLPCTDIAIAVTCWLLTVVSCLLLYLYFGWQTNEKKINARENAQCAINVLPKILFFCCILSSVCSHHFKLLFPLL